MKPPQMPLEGGSVKETVEQIIRCLPREKTRNRSPRQPPIEFPEDTIPPFWPVLNSPDGGTTYTFTLSDGYVFERTHAPWLPAGLSTAGLREQIAIDATTPQISIVVATDPDGVVTGVTYEVEAEDTASIEPDGNTVDGEIHYKLAVFHAAVSQYPAYLEMVLAGSHIFYERRGGDLGVPSHPWKVTENGDDTVTVAAGRILTIKNEQGLGVSEPPTWVRLQQAAKFNGGNVESIAASGYIYAYLPATVSAEHMFTRDDTTGLEVYRNIPSGSLTVAFSATLPENSGGSTYEFCFVIAEVAYAAGIVTVTEQVLTHNPTMWHIDMPPEV